MNKKPSTSIPAIILVEPQLGVNIGACARAMMNCGLSDLRIVAPRDGWPNEDAIAMSANAVEVIEQATLYDTLDAAIEELDFVLATTARQRDMVKPVFVPKSAAQEIAERQKNGGKVGIMFGRERSGLENHHVARANALLNVPLNPENTSLNLAQAVLLIGYEWFQLQGQAVPLSDNLEDALASRGELDNFLKRLTETLGETSFFGLPDKRPRMERNIRNIFERADLTQQEVNTLHGIVRALRNP